jgi:hypothetical protein
MSQAEIKPRAIQQQAITSLDNTSHPGRPGADELVPSRYALRIGEIDVLVISDGVVTPPAESMATNADPAVRAAWLDAFLSRDAFEWALNAVVVRGLRRLGLCRLHQRQARRSGAARKMLSVPPACKRSRLRFHSLRTDA